MYSSGVDKVVSHSEQFTLHVEIGEERGTIERDAKLLIVSRSHVR